jgi:4-amino-4-deoxy-L-arabinose transferase-like glycosyltransferase
VVASYLASAAIVGARASFSWHDDWVFARSAEILLREHRLHILDPTAPNAVFEAVWGASFGGLLGMDLGILRLSSVVLVACSIPAAYLLALELTGARSVAALAAATYVFTPVFYVLGFSYMTDAHFVALEMIAMFVYFRAVRGGIVDARLLLLGSVVASIAFLSRQQGVFLPAATVAYLLLRGVLRFDGRSVRAVAAATAIPVTVALTHTVWLRRYHGLPSAQAFFFDGLKAAGVHGMFDLLRNVAAIAIILMGFFLLPVGLGVASSLLGLARQLGRRGAFAGLATLLAGGLLVWDAWPLPRMPAATSWLARNELGPASLVTARQEIFSADVADVLTVLCAISAAAIVLGLFRRTNDPDVAPLRVRRGADALFFVVLLFAMIGGVLFGSVQFAPSGLDRYYLPLLPPAFGLAVLAFPVSRRRLAVVVGTVVVAGVAAFAVAGTHDSVQLEAAVWRLGDRAVEEHGIALHQLDAGPGWDGYHMGHTAIPLTSPGYGTTATVNPPWWIVLFAPGIDSTYVIATDEIGGWQVVDTMPYSSWLHRHDAEELKLLRRPAG